MKTRMVIILAAFAVRFVTSAQAFSGDLAGDVNALDELSAVSLKYEDACNKKDTAALAALFTHDAICVTPQGLLFGREAIEKASADEFDRSAETSHFYQTDQLNAIGNGAWSVGQWWRTLQREQGPVFARGYWSALFVREAHGWKLRLLMFNESSPQVQAAAVQ
jgi:uncharacterized protein (TIGR02246 family)